MKLINATLGQKPLKSTRDTSKEHFNGKLNPAPPVEGYKNVNIVKSDLPFLNPIQGCMSLMDVKMKYLNSIRNEIKKCPKVTLKIGGKSKLVLLDSGTSSSVMNFSTLLSIGYNKKNLNK